MIKGPFYRLKRREAQRELREAVLAEQAREMEQQKYPDFLVAGEDIWIGCKEHTVQPGETLESIARLYTVTIEYVCYSNSVKYVPPLTVIEWP